MQGSTSGQVDTSCMVDASANTRQIISLQMCGNGIVDDGEDCDPGVGSNSTCCDVSTCKFRNGAVCDPESGSCCTEQCTFAPSGQVCRPSKDSTCDTQETCTGNSGNCPQDVFAPNGQSCGDNGLQCASGQCTSLDSAFFPSYFDMMLIKIAFRTMSNGWIFYGLDRSLPESRRQQLPDIVSRSQQTQPMCAALLAVD
jgi:hypothetical protein